MADIAVVGRDTKIGMPATRFLGPALGSLHMFFHRLGPVLARRMLLTGDIVPASDVAHLAVFTEVVDDDDVAARADWWASKVARMPADGLVMAKEAFRLVEQLQGYQGEEVASYLFHAYGTNLQFETDEFNFVKTRAEAGHQAGLRAARRALRDPRAVARSAAGRARLSGRASRRTLSARRPAPAPIGSRACRWRGGRCGR